jgi:hypothetical protein
MIPFLGNKVMPLFLETNKYPGNLKEWRNGQTFDDEMARDISEHKQKGYAK